MLDVTASAVVPAPPEAVFELLSDTARYPEWVTGTDAVTRTDGPASEGSTYDEVNPIMGPWRARTHWQVMEHEPPRRTRHSTGDIPLSRSFEVQMSVAPEGDGGQLRELFHRAPVVPLHLPLHQPREHGAHRPVRRLAAQRATRELGARQARA